MPAKIRFTQNHISVRQTYIAGLGLPCFDPGHFRPRVLTILLTLERLYVGDDGVDLCAGQVELGHRWVGIGELGAQSAFRHHGIVGDRLEGGRRIATARARRHNMAGGIRG